MPLAAGDLLLLLTDGAAEAQDPDGAFFETERVLRVVAEERHRSAAQIVAQPADGGRDVLPGQPPGGRHHGGGVQGRP